MSLNGKVCVQRYFAQCCDRKPQHVEEYEHFEIKFSENSFTSGEKIFTWSKRTLQKLKGVIRK